MTTVNSKMNGILTKLSKGKYTITTLQELLTVMNKDKVRSRTKKKRRYDVTKRENTDKKTGCSVKVRKTTFGSIE